MQNGGPTLHDGISRLSVSSQAVENGSVPNGAIIPVGEVKTASLPAPDLKGVRQVETHTRALGVIQPPPDLKAIVDKTASYVAKNGQLLWFGYTLIQTIGRNRKRIQTDLTSSKS